MHKSIVMLDSLFGCSFIFSKPAYFELKGYQLAEARESLAQEQRAESRSRRASRRRRSKRKG